MKRTITGRKQNCLLPYLRKCINNSVKIKMIVSFIMDSGVNLIIKDLKFAMHRGADIKILTSDYMSITEPNALYRLFFELNKDTAVKLFKESNTSFHPKTYIFEYSDGGGDIFIGSSNLSKTALLDGVEWNYNLSKTQAEKDFQIFISEFNELYDKNSFNLTLDWIREYQKNFKKNFFHEFDLNLSKNITTESFDFESIYSVRESTGEYLTDIENSYKKKLEPINFQIGALYELSKAREEGHNKALIIAATGLGKTYLAAFDSLNYDKILFVAHREEILNQAEKIFQKVHSNKTTGRFINKTKEIYSSITFASIQTLGKNLYLQEDFFHEREFDYIIIDEFHHSPANTYMNLINYFKPKFLLGITATPDRMDNKDIYKLCDYNIAYECNFKTAINNGWLTPFKYYGIFDDIDYNRIAFRNGKYDTDELDFFLIQSARAEKVLDKYKSFRLKKTIAFCSSIRHCDFMTNFFRRNSITSKSVHSQMKEKRTEIIDDFQNGIIDILFVVDVFNEGVDMPEIESIMFLRPTESYTVFIQQLGRGLRLNKNKAYLTVLDFVGNYKGAHLKPLYLSGETTLIKVEGIGSYTYMQNMLPLNCDMNIEFKLLDLFKEMAKNKSSIKQQMIDNYYKIKDTLRHRPSMVEMFENSNYPLNFYRSKFGSWLQFKEEIRELEEYEKLWMDNSIAELLIELEKTSMTKSYKIPVFLSFIQGDRVVDSVTYTQVIQSFRNFYSSSKLYQKDLKDQSNKDLVDWSDEKLLQFILKNPVNFLSKNRSSIFFEHDKHNKTFSFSIKYRDKIKQQGFNFLKSFSDVVDYRKNVYFHKKFLTKE